MEFNCRQHSSVTQGRLHFVPFDSSAHLKSRHLSAIASSLVLRTAIVHLPSDYCSILEHAYESVIIGAHYVSYQEVLSD